MFLHAREEAARRRTVRCKTVGGICLIGLFELEVDYAEDY